MDSSLPTSWRPSTARQSQRRQRLRHQQLCLLQKKQVRVPQERLQRRQQDRRGLFSFLKSSRFINFLQELTGIPDIVPDPHFVGAGIHQTLPGGFLQIHTDFNRYPRYNWFRRVNVFIFLNPNWDDNYGGHLELWDREVKDCAAMIRPSMGRLVVFSSTDFSYHGHPEPLQAPATRSRRSLAMYYYYSMSRPKEECVEQNCESDHSTLWQTPKCSSCLDPACRKVNHII